MSNGVMSVYGHEHPLVAANKYNIARLKETQGDLEGARIECEQMYEKLLGTDHEETPDAAMRAQTVGEEEEDEEGEEGDSDHLRRRGGSSGR